MMNFNRSQHQCVVGGEGQWVQVSEHTADGDEIVALEVLVLDAYGECGQVAVTDAFGGKASINLDAQHLRMLARTLASVADQIDRVTGSSTVP